MLAIGQRIWRQLVSSYRLLTAGLIKFSQRTDSQTQDYLYADDLVLHIEF